MTTNVYENELKEFFQINDQVLEVLPSDIAAFSDNAVYEESFVRSNAVFAFRSKYSRGKVIITLPISISAFSAYDSGAYNSQNKGLRVLNQLSNFPFCFIKSSRVRSYLSNRASISSTGFMMFAVDEINTVHDLRVPDVLFAEFHLVFCDHTSQAKDFKFYHNSTSPGLDDPADSGEFVNAFTFDYYDRVETTFKLIKAVQQSEIQPDSSAFVGDNNPLGSVVLMAPTVLHKTEINEDTYEDDLKAIKSQGLYKEVICTAPDGQDSLTAAFFRESNQTTDDLVKELDPTKDAKQHFHIYWTAFHDLSFGGASAVKSIKISRKNKLAQQFIGTHKYPFVQYMGKYPARVEIGMDFIEGNIYKQDQTSVVSAVGQINNILDYNNDFYPEISAYNVLKIQSVSSVLMGIESLVPNQTFIAASSDQQGVESVNINFVEADVDEFMQVGNIFEGRPSQVFDNLENTELTAVLSYLKAIQANESTRKAIEDSPDRAIHTGIMRSLNTAMGSFKKELFGSDKEDKVIDEFLSRNTRPESVDGDTFARNLLKSGYDFDPWPSTDYINSKYEAHVIADYIYNLEQRKKIGDAYNTNLKKSAEEEKASSGIKYTVRDKDGKEYVVDASTTYSRQGKTDLAIKQAYQAIVTLRNKGDVLASSIIKSSDTSYDYLVNRINSYTGNNIKDLPLKALTDPNVDPFYFLVSVPYFTKTNFVNVNDTLSNDINNVVDQLVTKNLEHNDSSTFGKSGYWSLFKQSGISVEEMYIVYESDDLSPRNAAGAVIDVTAYTGTTNTYSGMSNKNSTAYDTIILAKAKKYGVDAGLIKAIMHQESQFNPKAVSPAGARGLMQLVPKWHPSVKDYFDPEQNIDRGAQYISELYAMKSITKGRMDLVLAAYNAGQSKVQRYGDVPPFDETQEYVRKVTHYYNTLYKAGLDSNPSSANYQTGTAESTKNSIDNTIKAATDMSTVDLSKYEAVTITEIEDGDTFKFKAKRDYTYKNEKGKTITKKAGQTISIRTKHYETPEVSHPIGEYEPVYTGYGKLVTGKFKGQTYGKNSTEFARQLLAKEKYVVYIEKTPEGDVYGRMLTSVYLPSSRTNIAEPMMKSGNALIWAEATAGGSAILNTLTKMQDDAKRKGIGLWAPNYVDSQNAAVYKRATEGFEKEMREARNESQAAAIVKKYSHIMGEKTYKIGDKVYNVVDSTVVKKPEDVKPVPEDYKNPYGTTNTDVHVQGAVAAKVDSQFGIRKLPSESVPRLHSGIDYNDGKNLNVIAAADGVATRTTMDGGGKVIGIDHGNGFYTKYLHLANYLVADNTRVKTGQIIATMGDTNTNKGTRVGDFPRHLHQETWVKINGTSGMAVVNPWKTTSLKLLTQLKGVDVEKNLNKFIDPTYLASAHPSSLGKDISGVKSNNAIYGVRATYNRIKGAATTPSASSSPDATVTAAPTLAVNGVVGNPISLPPAAQIKKREQIPPESSVYNEKINNLIQAESACYPQRYGVNTAIPAIKMYVVIGNEVEDPKLMKEQLPNYYFEIEGIKDAVLVCNNDENPVDFLSFKIANASFIRTDTYAVVGKILTRDLSKVGTSAEISFIADRIRLKPGTQLHVRAGYGNNPNNLRTIFNGVIVELGSENGPTLDVVAEGYGRELLSDSISPNKPWTPGMFTNNSTPLIISTALGEREGIGHFGNKINFWTANLSWGTTIQTALTPGVSGTDAHDYSDPETKRLTTKYADFKFRPGNYRQRLFTNIYAAEIEQLHQNYNSTWWNRIANLFSLTEQSGYYYIMHGQTPWAVLKEMEYRHPGTLAKPLFYQDRMTMFFGIKEQMYICRDLDSSFMSKVAKSDDTTVDAEYIKSRHLRFDTVTNFHILSTELNIIQNNISINAQYSTGVNVVYFEDKEDEVEKAEGDDLKEFKMKVDDNLAQWEHRYKTLQMPGIHGKYSAFMYGTTELRRQTETMYGGSIIIVGNPCIKAGDVAYLSDNLKRMNGIIKVRECRHYFDESRGYITEITPGLFVEASSFIYSTLFLRLAFTARTLLANATLSTQIVANQAADFQSYMDYFKTLQPFVKPQRGFGDISQWVSTAWKETGGTPVLGLALTGLSAYVMYSVTGRIGSASFGYLSRRGILNAKDVASLRSAISSMSLRSATAAKMFTKSASYFSKIRTASKFGKIGMVFASLGSATGGAAWWGATRSLAAITRLASGALLSNPIGWLISIAGMVAWSFIGAKVQEAELTRQPLIVFPLLANGRPYTGGMTGYNYNTYWDSVKQNLATNWEQVSKAGQVMEATSEHAIVKAIGSMLSNSNLLGTAESYEHKRVAQLQGMAYKGEKVEKK